MGVIVPVGEGTATFVFTLSGTAKQYTTGFGITGTNIDDTSATAEALWEIWRDEDSPDPDGPFLGAAMTLGWTFVGVEVLYMDASGPLIGQHFPASDVGIGAEPVPVNCSLLIVKQTALGGRRNKGRMYVPACSLPDAAVTGAGTIEAAPLATIQERFSKALIDTGLAGVFPCLHHSDGSPGTQITALSVQSTIATQRRRLR